jgi:HTH-type transcriptional regulator/antitoxin HipB
MRVRTSKDIGLVIREQRKTVGLSQEALAAKVGVGRQWIVEVEKGKPRADAGLLLRVLSALDLDVDIRPRDAAPSRSTLDVPPIDIDAVIESTRGPKR